jgi:hypothetical protein
MKNRLVLTLIITSGVCTFATPRTHAGDATKSGAAAPAAVAAPKKVDRTSVKAVVQAFGAAVATGDKATAKWLTAGTARQLEYVEAMIDDYQAIIRFDEALKARFRGDADDYLDYYERYGELSKKAEVEVEGDGATATFEVPDKDFEEEWLLVKRNGQWSLDANQFWDPKEETDVGPEQLRESTKAVDAVTKRITAGQFSDVDDAIEAFDETQDLSKYRKD